MEDFVVTPACACPHADRCPLVPDVPHLRSGSCSSPCIFGLGFLQTPPHDDALALLLTLSSANTWYRDFHPASHVPCLAHTLATATSRVRCLHWSGVIGRVLDFVIGNQKNLLIAPIQEQAQNDITD